MRCWMDAVSTLTEALNEGRDAPLYHFTRLEPLMDIVKADQLGSAEGISLTRNVNTPYFSHGFWNHVALVLDQTKLGATYPLEPRAGSAYADDFTLFQKSGRQKSASKEQEEFSVRPIKPLHRYLTHIVISDSTIMNKLMRYMRWAIAGRPMPKVFGKFEDFIKRQGGAPTWHAAVLDPTNWKVLFDYCKTYDVVLTQQTMRSTFGPQKANLWPHKLRQDA
jgi:hypothetical protein